MRQYEVTGNHQVIHSKLVLYLNLNFLQMDFIHKACDTNAVLEIMDSSTPLDMQ